MDFRRLRYFLAVAEELHFTRAAARLGIAQPPLSQQIRLLEAEVGAPLFRRGSRGVTLTEAGRQLAGDARDILDRSERALVNARRAARGEIGAIRIGFTASASFNPLVMGTIRDYRARYPDVGVDLVESNTAALLTLLAGERLDAAFCRPGRDAGPELRVRPLTRERMLACLPAGHGLASLDRVPLAAMADETFVIYPRRHGRAFHDAIVDACARAGFSARIVQEAPQMSSIVNLIAAGVGVSVVPDSMSRIRASGVVFREIDGIQPEAALDLVSRRAAPSSPAGRFLALVEERVPQAEEAPPTPPPAASSGAGRRKAPPGSSPGSPPAHRARTGGGRAGRGRDRSPGS